jgi:hypothetical protein
MARKTWPNPCSAEDVARESSDMPNEALMVPGEMSECRALVVAGAAVEPRRAERPQAAFLTQLIACERRIGAYRSARRASSTDAVGVYEAGLAAGARSFHRVV